MISSFALILMSGHISEAQINLHGHDSPKDLLAPSGKTGYVPLASSSHPHQKPDLGKSLFSLSQSFNILEVLSFSKNILPNIYFVYFIGNLKYSEIILLTFSLSLWNSALFPIFMLLTWISLYIKTPRSYHIKIPKSNRRSFKCNQCGIVNIEDIQSDGSHVRLTRRGRGVTAVAGRLTEVTSNATAATAASATSWIDGLQQMETARWHFHTLHQNTSEDKAFLLGTAALKECRIPYRCSFNR